MIRFTAQRARRLAGKTIAISTSDVDDPGARELSSLQQRDLVIELARQLLAMEGRIAYGGDFRKDGITELLVEAQRAQASSTVGASPRIVSYLLETLAGEERAGYVDAVEFFDVRFVDFDRMADDSAAARALDQAMSLRAMRWEIARDMDALVAVGGRTSGFKGWRPGIAEEIAAAVAAGKPVYLVGGFGGVAAWYAKAAFRGSDIPNAFAPADLGVETNGVLALPSASAVVRALQARMWSNGLTKAENAHLAQTMDADEIVALVLSGLEKISH